MSNDLAAEITGRVKGLLDGLLSALIGRWLPALPSLGQKLCTRYSDWVNGLFSRLDLPLTSVLPLGRSSNLWPLPLSYAQFDRSWSSHRKKPQLFVRQSEDQKDEGLQRLPVPEYFLEEDAGEGVIRQFQPIESEPAHDIILNVPTLMTSSARTRGPVRVEQLAETIALRLEVLADKGYPAPWHVPFEASGVPSSLQPVSAQQIGKVQMPVPMRFLPMTGTPAQAVSPSVPSSENTNSDLEPSGALRMTPSGQAATEAQITSLLNLSGSPLMTSNNIPAGKALPRLENFLAPLVAWSAKLVRRGLAASRSYLSEPPQVTFDAVLAGKGGTAPDFHTEEHPLFYRGGIFDVLPVEVSPRPPSALDPLLARSTNLRGNALAASPTYLLERPQVPSDAVLAGNANAVPALYPEEPSLFHDEETVGTGSVTRRYFERLIPQTPSYQTLEPHYMSPWHGPAGHIPPSMAEEGVAQEGGEPARGIASTLKNSSFGGYNGSMEAGLALAPVGRQRENTPAAVSTAVGAGQGSALQAASETIPAHDPEALALEVYSILKRRIRVEKERATSVIS